MSRAVLVVLAGLGLVTMGCDGDDRGDAGMIMIDVDSGPGGDAGPGGGTDAGPGGGMCSVSGLMPLPTACTPRCMNSTLAAANMCADAMCLQMTLGADTTPSTMLTGPGGTVELDCAGCFFWQRDTCVNDSCPTEFMAFASCDQMTDPDMCMDEVNAVNACSMANQMAVGACLNTRATQCFSTTMGGFFPDFSPPRLDLRLSPVELMSIETPIERPY